MYIFKLKHIKTATNIYSNVNFMCDYEISFLTPRNHEQPIQLICSYVDACLQTAHRKGTCPCNDHLTVPPHLCFPKKASQNQITKWNPKLYRKKNQEPLCYCFKLANTLTATHRVDRNSSSPQKMLEKAPVGTLRSGEECMLWSQKNLGSQLSSSKYKLHDLFSFLSSVSSLYKSWWWYCQED